MGFFGSDDPITSTSSSAPWAAQVPYLTAGFGRAEDQYQQGGRQFYPGQTYANESPENQQSMDMLRQLGQQGSQVGQGAQGLFNETIGGDYLNNNPFLDQTMDRASQAVKRNYQDIVQPGVNAGFSKGGRFGSRWHDKTMGTAQANLGDTLGNLATDIYGGNYQAERGRQQQMMGYAPQTAGMETLDAQRLGQVGQYQEGREGLGISEDINRFNFGQNEYQDNLDRYLARITGAGSGSTTTSSQDQPGQNTAQNVLGSGLLGASIGSQIGDGYGWQGALAGGLLGLF